MTSDTIVDRQRDEALDEEARTLQRELLEETGVPWRVCYLESLDSFVASRHGTILSFQPTADGARSKWPDEAVTAAQE